MGYNESLNTYWIYIPSQIHTTNESIKKHKAIFVSRGFSQVEGIDYEETSSHVPWYTSIWMIISLTTSMGWRLHQMDVKTTFLNRKIKEEVYIEQPHGFCDTWEGVSCVQVENGLVWNQATTSSLVCKDWWKPDDFWASAKVYQGTWEDVSS